MKKQIMAVAFSSLCISSNAFAVAIPADGIITTGVCSLIGSNITLNLSNNVVGAYECDQLATTVSVSACHTSGSRQPLVVQCVQTGATTDVPPVPIYNNASCPDGDGSAQDGQFTIADFRGYVASSSGGGVGAQELGGACSAASVEGILP